MIWFIAICSSFILGMLFMFIAYRYETKAGQAFIAESLDKTREIDLFWRQYRSAINAVTKQQAIDSQRQYWEERKKKFVFAIIGIILLIIFCVLLSLAITL